MGSIVVPAAGRHCLRRQRGPYTVVMVDQAATTAEADVAPLEPDSVPPLDEHAVERAYRLHRARRRQPDARHPDRPGSSAAVRRVIDLARPGGRPLVVGHRGAAAVAPENTLEGFRTAAALGVDLIEFDVLPLPDGRIMVAHSLEELASDAPLLDDVLGWFADAAPQ